MASALDYCRVCDVAVRESQRQFAQVDEHGMGWFWVLCDSDHLAFVNATGDVGQPLAAPREG